MLSKSMPSSAAHIVAANDLLTEILLRLHVRPLIRFKSVSKHWLSLITNPTFSLLRNSHHPIPPPPGGIFFKCPSRLRLNNPESDFVFLNIDNKNPQKPPFRKLNFDDNDPLGKTILQSCNGLLCCCTYQRGLPGKYNYYIYNPTTNQFTTLPSPNRRDFRYTRGVESVSAVNLAFDPSKSPHYKAVCVYDSETLPEHFEIEVYSSETGLWTPSSCDPFTTDHVNFRLPVYWNDSIHWISTWGDSLYFNLNEERIKTMPMPPMPEGWENRRVRYFDESHGHLHLIEIYGPKTTRFNVYEMERDYSKWFVKYCVDLDALRSSFPEMVRGFLDPSDLHYYAFVVLGVFRGEDDGNNFLVLHIPGKAIRYNLWTRVLRAVIFLMMNLSFPLMWVL